MIPVYVADFETSYENGKSWVWCYGIARLNSDKVKLGGSLNEFMQHIMSSGTKTIYFHNLKFDGKFILYYLLKNDYEYTDKIEKEHQYTHLIDDTGNFYSITIGYKLKNKIHTIKIIDSYKILPSSLDKLASDFGLELSKQNNSFLTLAKTDKNSITHKSYTVLLVNRGNIPYIKQLDVISRFVLNEQSKFGFSNKTFTAEQLSKTQDHTHLPLSKESQQEILTVSTRP